MSVYVWGVYFAPSPRAIRVLRIWRVCSQSSPGEPWRPGASSGTGSNLIHNSGPFQRHSPVCNHELFPEPAAPKEVKWICVHGLLRGKWNCGWRHGEASEWTRESGTGSGSAVGLVEWRHSETGAIQESSEGKKKTCLHIQHVLRINTGDTHAEGKWWVSNRDNGNWEVRPVICKATSGTSQRSTSGRRS